MAEKPTVAMGTYEEMLRAMTVRAETAEAALARIRNKIAEWKDRWPEHRMALNDCADELTILL